MVSHQGGISLTTLDFVESPVRFTAHAGFGRRLRETGQMKG
jgi:hypothetical protein